MVFKYAYLVPIITFLWFSFGFVISYVISVLNENVKPVFPYISDTGTRPPESCIFDILLTTGALFIAAHAYIRYRQVRELCDKNDFKPSTRKLNKISLYVGFISSYGIIIVGSFQETNIFSVHAIGAFMAFGGSTLYQVLQVIISFSIYPTFGKKGVNFFRAACAAISVSTLGLSGSFAVASLIEFKGSDITKWQEKDGGYDFHLVSTFTEWTLAIFTMCFLISFTNEFRQIHFTEPQVSSSTA